MQQDGKEGFVPAKYVREIEPRIIEVKLKGAAKLPKVTNAADPDGKHKAIHYLVVGQFLIFYTKFQKKI